MRTWVGPGGEAPGPRGRHWRPRGVAPRSSDRWLKEKAWAKERPAESSPPVSPDEALTEETKAVIASARKHPEPRHRELAWRRVDEDVAFQSPSTVDRVLKEATLVCPWRRRANRKKARRPGPTSAGAPT